MIEPALTDISQSVLAKRYLIRDAEKRVVETPKQLFQRVAGFIASIELTPSDRSKWESVFYTMMASCDFEPNTPCLVNAGRPDGTGQLSACFVLPIEDSIDGIFSTLRHMALVQKTGGGCIGGESIVLTDNGPTTMRQFVQSERTARVLSFVESGAAMWMPVKEFHTNNIDPGRIYEIKLDGQASIRASDWHPFFVWCGDQIKEVRADALQPGDAIIGSTRWNGRIPSEHDAAWLAGFIVSDGSFDNTINGLRLRICKGYEAPIRRAASVIGCNYGLSTDTRYQSPVWELTKVGTGAQNLRQQFISGSIDAANKQLPRWTWEAPTGQQLSLLIGLLDGDGWINLDSGDFAYGTISVQLALELEALCGMLGIRTRRRERPADLEANEQPFYEITIARSPWLTDLVNAYSTRHRVSWNYTKGVIPLDRKYVNLLAENGHDINTKLAWRKGIEIDGHRISISRWRQEGIATREVAALILRELGLDVFASAVHSSRIVKSVQQTTSGDILYDLTVPGPQNYVAGVGGFVVAHNTGFSFSRLRPEGDFVASTSGVASGPLSFMEIYDFATERIKQGGVRRGANMGIMRCDHPEIIKFINLKQDSVKMQNFNVSVAITDAFMFALENEKEYDLIHPTTGNVVSQLSARRVWNEIVKCAHAIGDPGLWFIDRTNRHDPLSEELGPIESTNPCGEVPLRPFDACCLGSINLSRFYIDKKSTQIEKYGNVELRHGSIDFKRLRQTVINSIRFLDNMLSVNKYPIPEITEVTAKSRKIGLGVMGWADLLIQLGIPYASSTARELATYVMGLINRCAIDASEELAVERGPFHHFEISKWKKLGHKPRRHSTVTVIAPTGTISMIAGCSSGIEPLFGLSMTRDQAGMVMHEVNPLVERIARREGFWSEELAETVRQTGSLTSAPGVPDHWREVFAIANELDMEAHIGMQAAFQEHVQDAVSKTINLKREATIADVEDAYLLAWQKGCKGITVYRDGCRENQVLTTGVGSTPPRSIEEVIERVDTKKEAQTKFLAFAASIPQLPTSLLATTELSTPTSRRCVPSDGRRSGKTFSQSTPFGTAHVTINEHPDDNEPFELFVRIGKSGAEVMAWAEATGRLVSYLLSVPSSIPPRVRLEEIANQLRGIGGSNTWGIGPDRIGSAPDAVAKMILTYLGKADDAVAPAYVKTSAAKPRDLCPDCGQATLTFTQRCGLCTSCGFSKC